MTTYSKIYNWYLINNYNKKYDGFNSINQVIIIDAR